MISTYSRLFMQGISIMKTKGGDGNDGSAISLDSSSLDVSGRPSGTCSVLDMFSGSMPQIIMVTAVAPSRG